MLTSAFTRPLAQMHASTPASITRGKVSHCSAVQPTRKKVAAKKTAGVKDAVVNFMTLKMTVEFAEGADPKAVMQDVLKNCKKVEDDCEIYL